MCALTNVEPFYDCGEKWTINLYDEYPVQICEQYNGTACASWEPPTIDISINQPVWYDICGFSILQHELHHLQYRNEVYCHKL